MVILPIVQAVGQQMLDGDHSKLLVMGAALMCSGKNDAHSCRSSSRREGNRLLALPCQWALQFREVSKIIGVTVDLSYL